MKREIEMKALTSEMSTQTDEDHELNFANYYLHFIYPRDTFFYIDPHGLVLLTPGGIDYTFPMPSPRKVENGKKDVETDPILKSKDIKQYAQNTELYLWARGHTESQMKDIARKNAFK